ncbi:MAG: hypothetical protein FD153_1240 [Rhodospirillaceae bacterium]|nr:MAG: hypothetical protein FD153_1240 [Rhodospirillaceae bacterium]
MELIERIRERAYQLWEAEGCKQGRDMEYWFRAEAQIAGEQAAGQARASLPSQTTSGAGSGAAAESATKLKDRSKTEAEMRTDTGPWSAPRKARSRKV